jgi:hypothetical protein
MNTTATVIRTNTESPKIDCAGVEAGVKMPVGLAMRGNLLGQKGKRTEKIQRWLYWWNDVAAIVRRQRDPPQFDVIVPPGRLRKRP